MWGIGYKELDGSQKGYESQVKKKEWNAPYSRGSDGSIQKITSEKKIEKAIHDFFKGPSRSTDKPQELIQFLSTGCSAEGRDNCRGKFDLYKEKITDLKVQASFIRLLGSVITVSIEARETMGRIGELLGLGLELEGNTVIGIAGVNPVDDIKVDDCIISVKQDGNTVDLLTGGNDGSSILLRDHYQKAQAAIFTIQRPSNPPTGSVFAERAALDVSATPSLQPFVGPLISDHEIFKILEGGCTDQKKNEIEAVVLAQIKTLTQSNIEKKREDNGDSLVHVLARYGLDKALSALIEKCQGLGVSIDFALPPFVGPITSDHEIFKMLEGGCPDQEKNEIEAEVLAQISMLTKPNIEAKRADNGDSLVHVLARHGFANALEALIEKCREFTVDINLKNTIDVTPLTLACIFGHDQCVRLLLAQPEIKPNKQMVASNLYRQLAETLHNIDLSALSDLINENLSPKVFGSLVGLKFQSSSSGTTLTILQIKEVIAKGLVDALSGETYQIDREELEVIINKHTQNTVLNALGKAVNEGNELTLEEIKEKIKLATDAHVERASRIFLACADDPEFNMPETFNEEERQLVDELMKLASSASVVINVDKNVQQRGEGPVRVDLSVFSKEERPNVRVTLIESLSRARIASKRKEKEVNKLNEALKDVPEKILSELEK